LASAKRSAAVALGANFGPSIGLLNLLWRWAAVTIRWGAGALGRWGVSYRVLWCCIVVKDKTDKVVLKIDVNLLQR
jgi:hypothetical protein